MPVLDTVAPRQQSDRPKGTNKVELKNGTRAAEIVDHYIFNVTNDQARTYTKEETGERNVRVKVRLDKRPDIILAKTFRLYLGKKAAYAQFLQAITGIEAGSEAMRAFNTDDLLSDRYKYVLVTTDYKEPYTNITAIMPRPIDEDDDLGQVPAHTPREPESAPIHPGKIKARLLELLRSNMLLKGEKDRAIDSVTGDPRPESITTPEKGALVVEALEKALAATTSDVPF